MITVQIDDITADGSKNHLEKIRALTQLFFSSQEYYTDVANKKNAGSIILAIETLATQALIESQRGVSK